MKVLRLLGFIAYCREGIALYSLNTSNQLGLHMICVNQKFVRMYLLFLCGHMEQSELDGYQKTSKYKILQTTEQPSINILHSI